MEIGLEVWGADVGRLTATARRAEELGFDLFTYGESPTGQHLDCWTMLAVLAEATERIRIGPVITNLLPDFRSRTLLARQAATVAAVSGGRLDFRTGAGAATRYGRAWWAPYGVAYPDYDARLAELWLTVETLTRLWAGEAVDVGGGEPVRLDLDHPPIPVTIAASGDRAMALAAVRSDVWESSFATPPEFVERNRRFAAFEGASVGRVARSLEIDAFIGTTPDRAAAMVERARKERGRAEDMDRILERALVGEPAQAAERISALATAGVDRLLVVLHDPHDADALEALAEARALTDRS